MSSRRFMAKTTNFRNYSYAEYSSNLLFGTIRRLTNQREIPGWSGSCLTTNWIESYLEKHNKAIVFRDFGGLQHTKRCFSECKQRLLFGFYRRLVEGNPRHVLRATGKWTSVYISLCFWSPPQLGYPWLTVVRQYRWWYSPRRTVTFTPTNAISRPPAHQLRPRHSHEWKN